MAMAKPPAYQNRIELLQGTLDMLVLQTLQWGPRHGYGITQAIRAQSGEALCVETGSLYPALHRMERGGLIAASWKQSESNQRVREYRLTAQGPASAHIRALAMGTASGGHRRRSESHQAGHLATPAPEGISHMRWPFGRRHRDLDDEIRTHLSMAEAERIDRGESPDDARRRTRREFGNVGARQTSRARGERLECR